MFLLDEGVHVPNQVLGATSQEEFEPHGLCKYVRRAINRDGPLRTLEASPVCLLHVSGPNQTSRLTGSRIYTSVQGCFAGSSSPSTMGYACSWMPFAELPVGPEVMLESCLFPDASGLSKMLYGHTAGATEVVEPAFLRYSRWAPKNMWSLSSSQTPM